MRQIQKPALVQNETNAKATNNNVTQRFLLCHTEINYFKSRRNSRNRRNAAHSPIFAEQIKISAISAISAGHKKDLRAQHLFHTALFIMSHRNHGNHRKENRQRFIGGR